MSVSWRATSQLLASRSVHIRIQPRPANLSESREVFRVMQRFGELSTYKYLRYEYHAPADNSAFAIYRDPDAAQKALNASPIRFSLEEILSEDDASKAGSRQSGVTVSDDAITPETPVKDGIEEITRASPLLNRNLPNRQTSLTSLTSSSKSPQSSPSIGLPFESPEPRGTTTKWFQITVDRSRAVHQDFVERQPYWKQFSPMKSMAQEDLAKVVPLIGLSDVSKRPPGQHRTPNKVLKLMSYYVDHKMPSLREMYEECGREKNKS
ncbi:uncharacterized protein BDR25DRAFT_310464 [Lindgomyces ingoldianus]|uniref:Uncharacterized protein n=1 Tax=Lindgomyces ingoldianus TaxID=673940 RepID=A0ACB6RBE3_9PLEO|nr:uncharacterized protein BDR25DRAFT_310464 [Lindgomyces ingoldianus]KAF2476063.1 hypothetical protein BDR25DRAFT_310464 [Lindgomyces ingoldianus]